MGSTADRDTFDRLMLEHLPAAQRFAVRVMAGDCDAAEEVVQNALLRAARGWQTFRGDATFKTWLLRIVINAAHDYRAARQSPGSLEHDPLDSRAGDPAALASASDLGEHVARLVGGLPPRQREVLVLTTYESLTPAEAAEVLGVSEQNVRTSLHLARQKLKAQLANVLDMNRGTDRPTASR